MGSQPAIDWEALKPEIQQLYLVDNKSLSEVASSIKKSHKIRVLTLDSPPLSAGNRLGSSGQSNDLGFRPAQLEFKIKQWQFRKNLTPKAWAFVAHEIRKRKREGKDESQVWCSGVLLPAKKVNKALSRYGKRPPSDRK